MRKKTILSEDDNRQTVSNIFHDVRFVFFDIAIKVTYITIIVYVFWKVDLILS